jgi:hypothetical protein
MMDGSLVYIDALAVNGSGRLDKTMDRFRVGLTTERSDMIYSQVWDITSTKVQLDFCPETTELCW